MKLQGAFTALVTPFRGGRVDEKALRRLIRRQLRAGICGLVPCGSTGEAATLAPEEYRRVIEITVEEAAGRVPVVPGVGTNSTERTAASCRLVESLGADALLVIVPYYNKPTQEGMFRHFSAAAEAVKIPVVVYNIPGRTGVNITPETMARLAEIDNIVALKEAAGSVDQAAEMVKAVKGRMRVYSGDDSLTIPMMAVGAHGIVSVASHVSGRELAEMVRAFAAGKAAKATELHLRLLPLFKALFLTTNPIPIKAALRLQGFDVGGLRLPLVEATAEQVEAIRRAMVEAGVEARK